MAKIVNFHRMDKNIGDLVSAPTLYFDFPGMEVKRTEISDIDKQNISDENVIVGGGGLLSDYFFPYIKAAREKTKKGKLVAWGIGQQVDEGSWWKDYKTFPYKRYLEGFDLVGVRDFNLGEPWVPCASCMHSAFDNPTAPEHEFVVFSHLSRQVPIQGWPTYGNDNSDFEDTIKFLSSGETVITSSYHGMYWALLLGRNVLVFPFNSKFFSFKYPVTLYPSIWKQPAGWKAALKTLLGKRSSGGYECKSVDGWRLLAGASRGFPDALSECREKNVEFYNKVLGLIG